MLYFPRPYPDEVIGSLLTRACRHTGVSMKALGWLLYGKQRSYRSFLIASSLRHLGSVTNLDPDELLWKHTVFPYVTSFMARAEVERLQAKVLAPSTEHVDCIASCTQSVTQGVAFRRYCLRCVAEDESCYGESYWHRAHQLPAVYLCMRHGEPLLETRLGVRNAMRFTEYSLPRDTAGRGRTLAIPQGVSTELASRSVTLLNRHGDQDRDWVRAYRTAALSAGYVRKDGNIASQKLLRDLTTLYGVELLDELGCRAPQRSNRSWPTLMFRSAQCVPFAPIKHVLLHTFLHWSTSVPKELDYGRPGPKPRDPNSLDRKFAARVSHLLARIKRTSSKVTVQQLLRNAQCWSTYRHDRTAFPETRALVEAFRYSPQSARRRKDYAPK